MANEKKLKLKGFEFKPFSKKQLKVLAWAMDNSPTSDKYMLVADGSIRSGKSIICSLAFVLWSMSNFDGMNFAITGKSSGAVRRNIVAPLKQMLLTLGYTFVDHRADNYLEITKGEITNLYRIFGGKDEASQDFVQGLTLAGAFLDEVVLQPESFFNQVTARTSVDGAKVFMCCNPSSPYSWFYKNVLSKLKEKNGSYIHFTMDDNPALSESVKERYKNMYSGVFAKRYIDGKYLLSF